jgi:2-polyprenyl-3-methyl-5-hydroxy-6-metoxy-1,4-benzoquinol methylase
VTAMQSNAVPPKTDAIIAVREHCPVCAADTPVTLLREAYDSASITAFLVRQYAGLARLEQLRGYDYVLVRCRRCQLAYQQTIPGTSLVQEIYDQWIPSSERERLRQAHELDDPSYWAQQIHFLIEHFRVRPASVKVLDFGMGWGEWAGMARAFGCNVYGAELSAERLAHAHSIGIPTLDWQEIGAQRFHFINTEQVFEHLVEPLGILRHLAGSLEEKGLLKISVPDARTALRRVAHARTFGSLPAAAIMPIQPLEHINCFEYRTLVRLAADAGLRPMRPSLRLIYNASSGWLQPRQAARLLLRPLYRHVYPKSTFVYFMKDTGEVSNDLHKKPQHR